nr:hypothetical protein [Tanacetum cinerariifolium]
MTKVVTAASATITVVALQLTNDAASTLTTAPSATGKRKGVKTKEQMDEEDSKALKWLNESQEDKAAKRKKLDEEVLVVDYEIYNKHNKPYYKIKRADSSHQLYLSFLSMLRNFDREDLEALWRLVKERLATTKPKNFSDDFLLTTLGAMFEKPDVQA